MLKGWTRPHTPLPQPLNFATVLQDLWPTGGRALSYCEELHLQKHSELGLMNIYTLIRRPDLSGCDRKGMMGLKELRQEWRQRYGSVNADPPIHITGCPLEATGGCVESFQLRLWEVFWQVSKLRLLTVLVFFYLWQAKVVILSVWQHYRNNSCREKTLCYQKHTIILWNLMRLAVTVVASSILVDIS